MLDRRPTWRKPSLGQVWLVGFIFSLSASCPHWGSSQCSHHDVRPRLRHRKEAADHGLYLGDSTSVSSLQTLTGVCRSDGQANSHTQRQEKQMKMKVSKKELPPPPLGAALRPCLLSIFYLSHWAPVRRPGHRHCVFELEVFQAARKKRKGDRQQRKPCLTLFRKSGASTFYFFCESFLHVGFPEQAVWCRSHLSTKN